MPFIDLNPASRPQPGANSGTSATPVTDPATTPTAGSAPVTLPAENQKPAQVETTTQPEAGLDSGLAQIASDFIDPELGAATTTAAQPAEVTEVRPELSQPVVTEPAPVAVTEEPVVAPLPSLDTPISEIPATVAEPLPAAIDTAPASQGVVEIKGPEFEEEAEASKLAQALSGGIDERINRAAEVMPELPEAAMPEAENTASDKVVAEPTPAYDPVSSLQLNVGTDGDQAPTTGSPAPVVEQPIVAPVAELEPEIPAEAPAAAKRWKPNLPSLEKANVASAAPVLEAELPPVESLVQVEDYQTATTSSIELKVLLQAAVDQHASDLHLTVGYRPTLRIDGKLKPLELSVVNNADVQKVVTEILHDRVGVDVNTVKDLDLAYQLPGTQNRFRINIFRQQETLAIVFRIIPNVIRSVDELRLPPVVKNFSKFAQGLVLVTGPTGSGKSTTLAALINEINMQEPVHIVTIEDPVEYIYPKGKALIDQRTVYNDTNTWSDALRGVLRQDPNVVLVGEMRDLETISAAIRVAETGHLVFATLHTNSASQSIDRIIDVFPEEQQSQIRIQLANVLMAVVSQRLIPVASGGRRVATEVMLATSGVRSAIRDNKVYQIDNMIQTGAELGMMTLEKSLAAMVREGLVSVEVAQTYANRPDDLLTLLSHR